MPVQPQIQEPQKNMSPDPTFPKSQELPVLNTALKTKQKYPDTRVVKPMIVTDSYLSFRVLV